MKRFVSAVVAVMTAAASFSFTVPEKAAAAVTFTGNEWTGKNGA